MATTKTKAKKPAATKVSPAKKTAKKKAPPAKSKKKKTAGASATPKNLDEERGVELVEATGAVEPAAGELVFDADDVPLDMEDADLEADIAADIDADLSDTDVLDELSCDLDEEDDFGDGDDEEHAEDGVDFDVIEGADFSVGFESELALDADHLEA